MGLRIGIDVRRYARHGRGQERYVRSLVHALAAAAGEEHELVLLGGEEARSVETLGARVSFSPAARRLRLQHRVRFAALRRLLVRGLDLVHFPLADGWYSPVMPSVTTIHDLSALRYPQAYFADAASERRARRHLEAVTASAEAVIAVSEATRRDVVSLLGVPEERVAVVAHGVEPTFRPVVDRAALAEVRRRYRLPARYLLFVGGIDFKKNVTRLLEGYAVARMSGRIPHVLALAGPLQRTDNPFFVAAQERARAVGVAGHVRWLGYVPDADLPSLYSGADAFVFPSLMEGFGLPVLEALACGTPVVTSAGSAMAEVAGEVAALVDPVDPGSIAGGILRVLVPEVAAWLRKAGPARAAGYTWERAAAKTIEVYERAAAGRPAAVAGADVPGGR